MLRSPRAATGANLVAVAHTQQLIGLAIDTCSPCPHPWPQAICPLCAPAQTADANGPTAARASDDEVDSALLRGLHMQPPTLVLRGGEMLLRPNALELLTACQQAQVPQVQLWTAGPLLARPGLAEAIRKAGATDVAVVLFGDTPQGHDYVAQTDGHQARVLAGVARARRAGLRVRAVVPLLRPTFRGAAELVKKAVPAGVAGIYLWAPPGPDRGDHPLLAPLPLLGPHVQAALAVAKAAGLQASCEGVPACLLGPHAGISVETLPAISAAAQQSGAQEMAFAPFCSDCSWRKRCHGVPQLRVQLHGWVGMQARRDPAELSNLPAVVRAAKPD